MEPKLWDGWDIFRASSSGRIDIVRLLIEDQKEDPNIIDPKGHRPIDYAIADDRPIVRDYLESVGGEPYRGITYSSVVPVPPKSSSNKTNPVIRVFFSLFSFDGRIGRLGFIGRVILAWVVAVIVAFAVGIALTVVGEDGDGAYAFVVWTAFMAGLSIQFAAGTKRLHDFDMSGWMQIIPIFNIIVFFMMVFKKASLPNSPPDPNREYYLGSQQAAGFEKILATGLIALLSLVWTLSALQDVQA